MHRKPAEKATAGRQQWNEQGDKWPLNTLGKREPGLRIIFQWSSLQRKKRQIEASLNGAPSFLKVFVAIHFMSIFAYSLGIFALKYVMETHKHFCMCRETINFAQTTAWGISTCIKNMKLSNFSNHNIFEWKILRMATVKKRRFWKWLGEWVMASQITWENRVPDSNQGSLAFHPNIQIAPLDTSLFQEKEFQDGMENGVGWNSWLNY